MKEHVGEENLLNNESPLPPQTACSADPTGGRFPQQDRSPTLRHSICNEQVRALLPGIKRLRGDCPLRREVVTGDEEHPGKSGGLSPQHCAMDLKKHKKLRCSCFHSASSHKTEFLVDQASDSQEGLESGTWTD